MDIIGGSKPKIVVGPSIIVGLCLRCPLVPNAPTSAPPAMHDYTILHFLMSTVIKKFTWLLVALRNGFGCLGKFWPPLDAADPGNEESPGLPSTKFTPITWTYNHSCRNLHKLSGRPPQTYTLYTAVHNIQKQVLLNMSLIKNVGVSHLN